MAFAPIVLSTPLMRRPLHSVPLSFTITRNLGEDLMPNVKLVDARLPEFGVPDTRPELDRSVYAQRFAALARARRGAGLDALLVYADREHAANLSYITGFDPRFEEALLVIVPDAAPTLLAGP